MSTSKLQRQTGKLLRHSFGGYVIYENIHPSWCLSDKGNRLELDFYIPELQVAVEVQGIQHYAYSEFMHGSRENFERAQLRDKIKRERCEFEGVELFEVFDDLSLSITIDNIKSISLGTYLPHKARLNNWSLKLDWWLEHAEWLFKRHKIDRYRSQMYNHCHKLIDWMGLVKDVNILQHTSVTNQERIRYLLQKMHNKKKGKK